MTRRAFVVGGLVVSVAPGPLVGGSWPAEAPRRIPILAILGPQDAQAAAVQTLRHELRELGYVEGRTLFIDERYAGDRLDRLPALAMELVRREPDVIFTTSTPGVLAARGATTTIPIVAIAGLVGSDIVRNLARPDGNVTGITLLPIAPKRLQLLKEAAPRITRVALLVNPANPLWARYERGLEEPARHLGVAVVRAEARGPEELDRAFAAMVERRADGVLVVNDSVFLASRQRIADLATRHRLPSASDLAGFAGAGGFLNFGPRPENFRRAAVYVDKVLRGARPADLPVEQPDTFSLVVNLKTARALGLAVPASVLARADEVVE